MADWPSTLPQNPFQTVDPTYTPGDNVLRTSMQGGPAKARPLFTAVVETLPVTLHLDPTQRATLRTFIATTLGYTGEFAWKDFRTGAAATYRYASKGLPSEKFLGEDSTGTWWEVRFDLELMP